MMEMAVVAADGLRGYVRTLRKHDGYTQDTLARAIGLSGRAYQDWERGVTRGMSVKNMLRIIAVLGASVEDISYFMEGEHDRVEGEARALAWLRSKQGRAKYDEMLDEVLQEIAEEYQKRPHMIKQLAAFIAGLHASGDNDEPPR